MMADAAENREQWLNAYLTHTKAKAQGIEDDRHFWAVEAMWELVERDPEGTWTIILDLLQRADGDYATQVFSLRVLGRGRCDGPAGGTQTSGSAGLDVSAEFRRSGRPGECHF